SFDNGLELLVMGGYPIAHAMMLMIPEAWAGNPLMDVKRRAFYEYHAALMEPWDGPAAVAFTDGKFIGATLDRNGLRPARYFITDDDLIVMSSEMGVLDIPQEKIVKKWRLQPGKMLLVDIEHGRIVSDDELKRDLAAQRPNLLSPDSTEPVMRLEVSQPILTFEDMEKLRRAATFTQGHFKSEILSMCYPAEWGVPGMEPALAQLCADAVDAVRKGTNIII